MAKTLYLAQAANQDAMNAITVLINTTGPGTIEVYGDTPPTDANTAIGAQTHLGTLTWAADAFADADATGLATAGAIVQEDAALATDIATWARILDGAGATVFDCNVGEAADVTTITLNNKSIVIGGTIDITAFTLQHLDGA